jgi:hypothetical protein
MKRILKYLQFFLFWLSGITLSAHLIIPHDHHISDTGTKQESNCPVNDDHHDKHKGFPAHCHFFNDLATEKESKHIFFNILQADVLDFSCDNELQLFAAGKNFLFPGYENLVPEDPGPEDYFSLRAPPVSA